MFALIAQIIATSSDFSCFASESFLAKSLRRRKADIHAAKLELITAGRLNLSFRPNAKRRNPKHRLTLPSRQHNALSIGFPNRVPDCGSCRARPLVGLDLWPEMARLDQIDCYLKSGWNACPLKPLGKTPIFTRTRWAQLDRDSKIDVFYHSRDLSRLRDQR